MAEKMEHFLVRRDKDGNVEPYEVEVVGTANDPKYIKILPTTIHSMKGLSDPDGDAVKWPLEDKVKYVREHVVEPDFGELTEEFVLENMTLWDLDMLLITAIQNGGPNRRAADGSAARPT